MHKNRLRNPDMSTTKPISSVSIDQYVALALKHAEYVQNDDGRWMVKIPVLPGLITFGETKEEAKETYPFYLDIVENSVIVFDRDDFMKRKFERLKKRMKELGTRKVFLPGGKWYWELKPGMKPGEEVEL